MDTLRPGHVVIVAPAGCQGLAVQARSYLIAAARAGHPASWFARRPGRRAGDGARAAAAPQGSQLGDLLEHCAARQPVSAVVFPEGHLRDCAALAAAVRAAGVTCVSVPNADVLPRVDAARLLDHYDVLWCHDAGTLGLLRASVPATLWRQVVATPIEFPWISPRATRAATGPFEFLLLGGSDALTRRNAPLAIQAFWAVRRAWESAGAGNAAARGREPRLTVTSRTDPLAWDGLARAFEQWPGALRLWQGHLSEREVEDLLERADVVVHVTSREGAAIGLREVLARAIPVIACDAVPQRHLVRDGIDGWLIPCARENATPYENDLLSPPRSPTVFDLAGALARACGVRRPGGGDVM
jgi:hypothetical protein